MCPSLKYVPTLLIRWYEFSFRRQSYHVNYQLLYCVSIQQPIRPVAYLIRALCFQPVLCKLQTDRYNFWTWRPLREEFWVICFVSSYILQSASTVATFRFFLPSGIFLSSTGILGFRRPVFEPFLSEKNYIHILLRQSSSETPHCFSVYHGVKTGDLGLRTRKYPAFNMHNN